MEPQIDGQAVEPRTDGPSMEPQIDDHMLSWLLENTTKGTTTLSDRSEDQSRGGHGLGNTEVS